MFEYYRRPEQVIAQLQHALSQKDQEISYYKGQSQQPENVLDDFDDDEDAFEDDDELIPGSTGAAAMNELDLDDELYYPKQHNQSRGSYPIVINSASTEMTPFKLGNNMNLQRSYLQQQQQQ